MPNIIYLPKKNRHFTEFHRKDKLSFCPSPPCYQSTIKRYRPDLHHAKRLKKKNEIMKQLILTLPLRNLKRKKRKKSWYWYDAETMHILSHQIWRILLAVLQQQEQIKICMRKKTSSINNFQPNIVNNFSTFCIEDIKMKKQRF